MDANCLHTTISNTQLLLKLIGDSQHLDLVISKHSLRVKPDESDENSSCQ